MLQTSDTHLPEKPSPLGHSGSDSHKVYRDKAQLQGLIQQTRRNHQSTGKRTPSLEDQLDTRGWRLWIWRWSYISLRLDLVEIYLTPAIQVMPLSDYNAVFSNAQAIYTFHANYHFCQSWRRCSALPPRPLDSHRHWLVRVLEAPQVPPNFLFYIRSICLTIRTLSLRALGCSKGVEAIAGFE
ncbi:hypothetical protein B0O80DRAFT_428426 [Mortierella sp. GBAus27b]|nr:hypothetical protein B0O80DRAFT_428426 [Mortierella sp. GBAus27b]